MDEERSPKYHSNMQNVCERCHRALRRPFFPGFIPSLLLPADKFQESSSEGLNAACVDAHKGDAGGAWKCIFAQWSSAHIKTPTFPMQSQYDAWQTGNVMGAPDPGTTPAATQNVFGKNLTALVKSQLLCAPSLCPAPFLPARTSA